jgi:hypothetical protein
MLLLVAGLVVASCSSAATETTTTESSTVTGSTGEQDEAAISAMCRTLSLLDAAGVPAGAASVALTFVDLDGLPTSESATYAALLISAPRTDCPDQIVYADEIAYWLGF